MAQIGLNLSGNVALVTGGGTGIGRAISLALAGAGADVAVAARTPGPLEETASDIRSLGRRSASFQVDVTKSPEVETLAQRVADAFGRIDILVNNAGIIRGSGFEPLWEITDHDWHQGIDVNLTTAFYCSRTVSKHMARNKYGRIINLASASGQRGMPHFYAYSCAKAAVMQLTRVLAVSLADYGITANCITLSLIRTYRDKEYYDKMGQFNPMGRVGTPEEVAPLAVYLASPDAAYVTGQIIALDGGGLADGYAPVGFRPERIGRDVPKKGRGWT